ncbi:MAG TPA: alpha/beta hydrolase [Rhizomicrobium sp.]|nr:alpha/beta hydrolase [Rhizomicrobium sp.]
MSKPPIVMIHGAFCGGWAFENFRKPFEKKGYRVLAPTLRHHDGGRPPRSLGTTSIKDYVRDIETVLDGLEEPAVLVGHSMGGLIAQMIAARRDVRATILLAPSPPWGVLPSTPFEIASAQALYMAGSFWSKPLKPSEWIAGANALDRVPEPERARIFERFVPESGLATFEIMHWALDLKGATQFDPRSVTCPILCLVGTRDRVNPPSTVRRIAQRYRGRCRYEELRDHSHWLVDEPGYEKIAARALDWLAEVLAEENAALKG